MVETCRIFVSARKLYILHGNCSLQDTMIYRVEKRRQAKRWKFARDLSKSLYLRKCRVRWSHRDMSDYSDSYKTRF